MWGSDIKKWAEGIMKWLDANWFKIKLFAFLFFIGFGFFLMLKAVETINDIESVMWRVIVSVFLGLGVLAVTYFISYLHGFKSASLKKDEEIKRYKKAVSDQENSVSQVVKLQEQVEGLKREIERKKEAYGHLKSEIRKIKSQEDREALEQKWDEIKDQYEMTVEKIQETASPIAETATQRVKVLVAGTQDLLGKGVTEAKKGIFKVFRKKEKDKGGEPD